MRTRLLVLVLLALAGAAATVALAATTATAKYVVKLSGRVEVPRGDLTGSGTALITVSRSGRVCWRFTITKIDGKPNAAHIHEAPRGKAGPVVVPFGTAYKARGCTNTKAKEAREIIAHPGRYYVNVHNAKHPAGALRGQL